ncbi:hypothetical protein [Streptomyces sp. NPDC001108]
MQPDFSHDAEAAAIYRLLRSEPTVATAEGKPSPARMPRRRTRPATAADIARQEGLDLGLERRSPSRTANRPERRRNGQRQAEPSVEAFVFDLAMSTLPGCDRDTAWSLAKAWAKSGCVGRAEVLGWAAIIGVRHPHAVGQLRAHGVTADMLELRIGGTTARSRLRNGESAGGVIAGLLELCDGNAAAA